MGQVSRFSLGRFPTAVGAFRQCADMRRRMCEVPGDAAGPLPPWEDHLPHPELAASYINVTVRSVHGKCCDSLCVYCQGDVMLGVVDCCMRGV